MSASTTSKSSGNAGGGLDFEAQLWAAADKMRGHMDASEYKHVCLGLSFRADLHPDLKADFIRFCLPGWIPRSLLRSISVFSYRNAPELAPGLFTR
jgi:hypothetical protein